MAITRIVTPQGSLTQGDDNLVSPSGNVEHNILTAISPLLQLLGGNTSVFTLTTSGSTGVPKEVRFTRQQAETSAAATKAYFNIPDKPRVHCCLRTDFVAGFMQVFRASEWEAELWIADPDQDPFNGFNWQKREMPVFDFVTMVPSQAAWLMAHRPQDFQNIQNLLLGGTSVAPELEQALLATGVNAFVGYGMTETVSHVAIRKLGEAAYQVLEGNEVTLSEYDTLSIVGPVTGGKLVETRDLVQWVVPGKSFLLLGRADRVINTGGIKVSAEWLEQQLNSAIQSIIGPVEYHVTWAPHKVWGQQIVLVVADERYTIATAPALLADLLPHLTALEPAKRPKKLITIPQLPKTATGKPDLQEIRQLVLLALSAEAA